MRDGFKKGKDEKDITDAIYECSVDVDGILFRAREIGELLNYSLKKLEKINHGEDGVVLISLAMMNLLGPLVNDHFGKVLESIEMVYRLHFDDKILDAFLEELEKLLEDFEEDEWL